MASELPAPQYNPKDVEEKIYKLWEESGLFNPDKPPTTHNLKSKTFSIVVPPPNVTGSLHMGHALNAVIQDILIRKKRMEGFKTLWLPGTDHAGIATQNVVEKELRKEGKSRHELGREKFLEAVWQWKEKYGNIILDQFKRIGSSMDWSRTRFTMDEAYKKAVEEAFIHYYKKGLIYRGERTINWCTRCATSLSDLEIEYREEKGKFYYIKYGPVVLGTVRPETKLGDTALAVNPKDKRYKQYIGKEITIQSVDSSVPREEPSQLKDIKIKMVADEAADPEFGTGVIKVTPAHDATDFEIYQRHPDIPILKVIGENGRMTKETGARYVGLKVVEARKQIIEDLEKLGLMDHIEDYTHNVSLCYRCGTVIEPLLSKQWFLKMDVLAKQAVVAVKSGKVKFHPKRWEKVYFDWLGNIKDWCISRQIWWGHRLPVWYCMGVHSQTEKKMGFAGDVVPQIFIDKTRTYRLRDHGFKIGDRVAFENSATGEIFGFATITEIKKTTAGEIDLKDPKHHKIYNTREELVVAFKRHPQKISLNTINEKTPVWVYTYDFKPVSDRELIEQFIVSAEKPKQCPFCKNCDVEQSADVLDTWFSSALWPLATLGFPDKTDDLKNYYPTSVLSTARDIINLWVARMVFSGLEFTGKVPFQDVIIHATILTKDGKRMSKSLGTGIDPMTLVEKYGADATRFGLIWQAMGNQDIHWSEEHVVAGKKFANKLWNSSRFVLLQNPKFEILNPKQIPNSKFQTPADKKILAALKKTKKEVSMRIEKYEFGQALHILYDFFWHQYCDVYLEKSKLQTTNYKLQTTTKRILLYVLSESLKLLHPFMPFITEEIWSRLPKKDKNLLIVEQWPQ